MSQIDINGLLSQMRTLAAQSGLDASGPVAEAGKPAADFGQALRTAIDDVDGNMKSAMSLSGAFTRGEPGAELPNVMLAMQKADLSFRAMNEVRNRLVEAYRDVMNLQM